MASRAKQLCQSLGIDWPIIQAPIGRATCPELVAAVSNAGGLGMLSVTWRSVREIEQVIGQVRALTDRPFGVNLVLEWPPRERLEACLKAGVRIVSFFWGDPAPWIPHARAAGAVVMHTVGSVEEGLSAASAGVDVVVAQGWESGGHVRGTVSGLALVPNLVSALGDKPVVAAGGIADGRGLAAALTLGASGVWLGTRFVATTEARAAGVYKDRIVRASSSETLYTNMFDGGWPNAPHRVLRNETTEMGETSAARDLKPRIGENDILGLRADGREVHRYDDTIPLPDMTGQCEAMALYAGQSSGLVTDLPSAGEVVRRMVDEARAALRGANSAFEELERPI